MFKVISAKGRRRSQRSSGKSGWVDEKTEMRWFLPVLTALSAGLVLWVCGGTNCTGNFCERKYSLHSNEVSLSTMRLVRGCSKEGKDRSKRRDIVRGRFRFLWGEVDISTEDGDKDILVPAARLNGQMTG